MNVAFRRDLSADYVRSLLRYEPETGRFFWIVSRPNRKAGSEAGCIRDGYVGIKINGRRYLAHRLAWLVMTGVWPEDEIDHRDLNRANNRWANLRPATHGQNQSNCRAYRHNSTGLKGAYPAPHNPFKFVSAIRKDGKRLHLGTFDTAREAHQAYAKAAQELHGEFRRAA